MNYISDTIASYDYYYYNNKKILKFLTRDDISFYINSNEYNINNYTERLYYMYHYFREFSKNFEYSYYERYYYENITDIYYYT